MIITVKAAVSCNHAKRKHLSLCHKNGKGHCMEKHYYLLTRHKTLNKNHYKLQADTHCDVSSAQVA